MCTSNKYTGTRIYFTVFPFQDLQTDQLDKIKELEKEVMVMRSKHSDTIQQLKSTFLAEKREYQQDSESRITALEKLANKVSKERNSNNWISNTLKFKWKLYFPSYKAPKREMTGGR